MQYLGVFSEHVLEHFYIDDAHRILQECFRILKSNGTLRLSVPDLDIAVQKYLRLKHTKQAFRAAESLRMLTQEYLHLSVWDYERLEYELYKIGFVDIKKTAFGVGRDSNLIFDLESRKDTSLYIEATKP